MNAYLHVPFCPSVCAYCDFAVVAGKNLWIAAYLEALEAEIRRRPPGAPLSTVFFGGGTPSLLDPSQVARLLSVLQEAAGLTPGAEVTLEANPETLDGPKLAGFREAGVTRLSLGAQARSSHLLRRLGRRHGWEAVEAAAGEARRAGFDNLNLDLLFGLPGQSLREWEETLEAALALAPQHLSCYALQVEEGTPLARRVAGGLALPPEEETAAMYALARSRLAAAGLEQVEVSNFAKPGYACRYNTAVWGGEDYEGYGVSAVGTVGSHRRTNVRDLSLYLERIRAGEDPAASGEEIPPALRRFERLMLGLRTARGVERELLGDHAASCGVSLEAVLAPFRERGWLTEEEGRVRLEGEGFFLLNSLLAALHP